ncbi:MAG: hypothetical protein N2449_10145 [Bacteroidales bacterium]|nr:hypothetical protein [Bacteroidales bacterium]
MKNIFIFFSSFLLSSYVFSQWTTSFDKLKMYEVKIHGFLNDEQALFLSRIISDDETVLIARFYEDLEGYIFSEQNISEEIILSNLTSIKNITLISFQEAKANPDKYLQIYNDFRPIRFNLSTTLPSPVYFKDKQKEEKAYSIFKSLWTQKYAESYKNMQNQNPIYTDEEIEELKKKNK